MSDPSHIDTAARERRRYLGASVALPLANPACGDVPCRVEIEYLAERGRDFDLEIDGAGPPVRLGSSPAPRWQTSTFAGAELGEPKSPYRTVAITPRGKTGVVVRRLAWTPALAADPAPEIVP